MASKNRWLLPTNTINLRMIIAQGIITSPDGFSKYYEDALNLSPGWIPVFMNKVPSEMFKKAKSERDSLTLCIIEFDLESISGLAKGIRNCELVNVELDNFESENLDAIFLPGPIPLSAISNIIFSSTSDKKQFEEDVLLRSNVVLSGLTLKSRAVDQKLFKKKTVHSTTLFDGKSEHNFEELACQLPKPDAVNYSHVYAFGGMLLNLFYYAKNGSHSNKVLDFSLSTEECEYEEYKDVATILNCLNDFTSIDSSNDASTQTYHKLIDVAINRKDFKEAVIEFLSISAPSFATKLLQFENRSDKPISEEFEEAKTPLQKLLLMLFLRENSDSLINYESVLFDENILIIFAMLFGIRDKFIKSPAFLKKHSGLQSFISVKMAEFAHINTGSDIKFTCPKKPETIWTLTNDKKMMKKMIKELGIATAIQTVMPNKVYASKSGVNTYEGFIEPTYRLAEDEYFRIISTTKVTDIIFNKLTKDKS